MRLVLVVLGVLLASEVAEAQERGHALEPSIAIAGTLPTTGDVDSEISGDGWLARLEYSLGATSYFAWKPYAALLMTESSDERKYADPRCKRAVVECEATTQAVLLGSKVRLALPIPWFAPFAEIGLGFSLGYSRTETLYSRHHVNAAFNLPFALGVALGPAHSVELSLPIYQLGGARQLAIGISLGFRIPIDVGHDDQRARPRG
jgi:hypothetical protein